MRAVVNRATGYFSALVEGLPKYEGINEAKALATALRIMKRGYDQRKVRNLRITAKDIEKLKIKAKVVFLNACQVSREDMANAFFKAGKPKCRCYIAPKKDVPFHEAFIVALLFYKRAFLKKDPNSTTH